MPPRRRAQLLLPSPLGLVEYDVIEGAVFVGPAGRGGLNAAPTPFREAKVALTFDEGGCVIRALPGEALPVVNGADGEGQILEDGDRVEVAGQTFAFRTADRSPAFAPASGHAPAHASDAMAAAGERARTPRSRPPAARTPWWVTLISLAGVVLLLYGVAAVVMGLSDIQEARRIRVSVPEPPRTHETDASPVPDRGATRYAEIQQYERDHPDDLDGALARYQDYVRDQAGSPHAGRARARTRELVERAAVAELARVTKDVEAFVAEKRFVSALRRIRAFDRRYGATAQGNAAELLTRRTRESARVALDALLKEVGPIVSRDPRLAHRKLLAAGPEFPPDLASEITEQMERALQLIRATTRPPPPPPGRTPNPPGRTPGGAPGATPPGGDQPTPYDDEGPTEGLVAEVEALAQWKSARADLLAGRYADAFQGYTLLIMRYGNTDAYRNNKRRITAGRYAAKVGAQGPEALLSVPAKTRNGRIDVEYTFGDARIVERDFTIEQPFASDREVKAAIEGGVVTMSGATGLFHLLVWEPDVTVEAEVYAEVARDFGILAVEHSDDYRCVMFNLGNTRFTLKKGDDARANPGHILWFMGQGVWADADADAIGYIKIAERTKVKLTNAELCQLTFIRKGDKCEAVLKARSDDVSLRGAVKGDDGGSMGSAKIGVFTNTGIIQLKRLRISGRVDQTWFETRLGHLIEEDPGPDA